MRIKILLATIFCLLSCLVFGQASPYKKIADSLEKRLPFAKNDTSKVKLLNNASMNFAYTYENEKSFRYASEALALARRLKWKKGIVHAYKHIGLSYEIQSDQKTANEYVLKAFNVALETNDNLLKGEMYEAMGVSQWNINLEVSMKYFDKAMKFYKAAGYIAGYNSVLLQKGGTYSNQGKYYEAADCFREVMKNGEKAKDTGQAITGSNYLAGVYSELGNDVKALEYYLKALDLLERLKNEGVFTALVVRSIGDIYSKQNKYQKAIDAYNKALKYIRNTTNRGLESTTLLKIAGIYGQQNDSAAVNRYFEAANKVNENNPFKLGKMNGFLELGEFKFKAGKYSEALVFHKESLKLCKELGLKQEEAVADGNIGMTYAILAKQTNKSENAAEAVKHLERSVTVLKSLKNLPKLELYSQYLSQAYEMTGENAMALSMYKEYVIYRDSIYDKTRREQFTNQESEYEYFKKESVLKETQRNEIAREQLMRNYSLGGVGVMLLVASGAGYGYRRKRRDNRIIAREKKRSDDLLLNILPHEVAEELKEKGEANAQLHSEVSILFTDFEGFTKLSEKLSPTELIGELNYCFKAFDTIVTKHNIEKIKTIGDAYMAVSGLPSATPDHAENIVNAAIEIRDFMQEYKKLRQAEGRLYFEMRIGINSGEVVAGIVGIKKFAYDIWGDAVNIAARMESSCITGKINISESTYELVKDNFDTEYRGEIEAKGKGTVKMYFVEPAAKL